MKISIIVPCHNEEKVINETYKRITSVASKSSLDYELLFEEDGSSDNTGKIITDLAMKDPKVKSLSYPKLRKGKGWGFKKLVSLASGKIIVMMDADLSCSPGIIPEIIKTDSDILVMDRYSHPDSVIPLRRFIPSRIYNLLLRVLFGIKIKDTQSGFKAFKKNVFDKIKVESDGFEYDIELLAKAYKKNLVIKEMPVRYVYRKDGQFSVKKHGPAMLLKTLRMWKHMNL